MEKLTTKVLLLVAMSFFAGKISAYDFKVDGVFYNVLSFSDMTCEVTYGETEHYRENVVIPAEVTYNGRMLKVVKIGTMAFEYETAIKSLTIGSNVTTIEHNAFYRCTSLQKLTIDDGDESIFIDNYYSSTPAYGEPGFHDCPLTDIYVGREVTYPRYTGTIGGQEYWFPPFNNQLAVKNLTFGDKVSHITNAYYSAYYETLQKVSFGKKVSAIDAEQPFGVSCTDIKQVYSYNSTPPECDGDYLFPNSVYLNATLYVPQGAKTAYENAYIWSNFWNIVEMESTGISNVAREHNIGKDRYYDLDGSKLISLKKGVNIVRKSDGTTIKEVIK